MKAFDDYFGNYFMLDFHIKERIVQESWADEFGVEKVELYLF
jgi:hypothetical protein